MHLEKWDLQQIWSALILSGNIPLILFPLMLLFKSQWTTTCSTRTQLYRIQLIRILLFYCSQTPANQISGSLDIPSALCELKESKVDTFQDIDICRATHHDFFQHEEDLSIIPTGDTISKDKVPTLEHLPATAAAKLTDVLNNYKSKSKFNLVDLERTSSAPI